VTDKLIKDLHGIAFDFFNDGWHEQARTVGQAIQKIQEQEKALHFAAGMISTMPPFDIDHPEKALEWIMEESRNG